ncbi:MAG: sigma factor-like helix-turn-helix DNA-binding protein [Acidimicrobiia bacterium]
MSSSVDHGDDGALFIKLRPELIRYANALVGPSEGEDIVMTVVGRTLKRVRLSDLDNPKGYLLKAVLNEARGLGRRASSVQLGDVLTEGADPGMAEVVDVLMALPTRQRAAIYLHYWEGLGVSDTAQAMGVGPGTVKRYLHLARKKLKGVL